MSVARATAWTKTLRRAAGKNPWGNARWIAKYRNVPVISPPSSSSVNDYSGKVSKTLLTLAKYANAERYQGGSQRSSELRDRYPIQRTVRTCAHGDAE